MEDESGQQMEGGDEQADQEVAGWAGLAWRWRESRREGVDCLGIQWTQTIA
jgi:hypothetical protein